MAKEIKVHGLKELREAMKELPLALEDKALQGMLMAGAKPTLDAAKALAPQADKAINVRGENVEPGRLRNNIARRTAKRSSHDKEVHVYVRSSQRKKISDPTNAWFWWFVEFGTSKQSAQPYMRPAFESTKEKALKIIAQDGWKKIRLQAKKLHERGRQRVMARLGK